MEKLEEWKDIPNYPGIYQASNLGNIRSIKFNKLLTPWKNNRGYLCVKLYFKGFRTEYKIHQLICQTFMPEGETKLKNEVHHRDFNKENNALENLEWCTRKKNMRYNNEKNKKKSWAEEVSGPF